MPCYSCCKNFDGSSASSIEVLADDLGSRTIPTAVAFRHRANASARFQLDFLLFFLLK